MSLIGLLRSKNRYLEKFREISREFEQQADAGDFGGLERFQETRDKYLNAIARFDKQIETTVSAMPESERTDDLKKKVSILMLDRENLVHEILAIDLRLMGRIETEKSRILRELTGTRKSKETLGKFKSSWMTSSGEELDTKL